MSLPTPRIPCLLVSALLAVGCASTPPAGKGQSQGQSQSSGAGGTAAPQADPKAASKDAGNAGTPAGAAGSAAGADAGSAAAAAGTMGAGSVAAAGGPGQTSEERRAAIDKRLDDSLGTFGAQLRNEQQQVAKEHDAHQSTAGSAATEGQNGGKGGDASGTASTEVPQGESSKGSGHQGGTRRDHSGDLKSERASKKPDDNAGNGAAAREIPDGSDDDVVARRLRQAAEQETDPELKEKLWKEYIDYKKNSGK